MMDKVYRSVVSAGDFYKGWLGVLNGMLGLSRKELVVMSAILTIRQANTDEEVFSIKGRKALHKLSGISEAGFNNYIMVLKRKGLIQVDGDLLKVNPGLLANVDLVDGKYRSSVRFDFELR